MDTAVELAWGSSHIDRIDGVDVHVEHAGPVSSAPGRPVIAALHGFASGTFTWAGVAPGWAQRWPVVAWDRPPFGRSGRPTPGHGSDDPYCVDAELARSAAVVEPYLSPRQPGRPGSGGVVLVGHSAGALVAVQLALADRLPVRGLVLLAPALAAGPPALIRRLATIPGAGQIGPRTLGVATLGARTALRMLSRHPTPLIEATAAATARSLRRPGTAEALWHLTTTWKPARAFDDLGSLALPALVIGGADDRISPVGPTTEVATRLGAELQILDGVGHAAHEQIPEVVGPLIGAFVEGIGR